MKKDEMTALRALALARAGGGSGGGGGVNLENAEIYLGDYLNDPPTITEGALDTLNRRIYVV